MHSFHTRRDDGEPRNYRPWYIGGAITLALLILLVGGCMVGMPEYRLYKAGIEKRIRVEEARATRDAAVHEAQAERERARGVADANEIIAASITEEYLRYHYINTLAGQGNRVIYIPTEAGLPILEAGKRDENFIPEE